MALVFLASIVCPNLAGAPARAGEWDHLTCWVADRSDHLPVTLSNETAVTVVWARGTREFGFNRCGYVADRDFSTHTPPPHEKTRSLRRFFIDVTLRNGTSKLVPAGFVCKFYDEKGAFIGEGHSFEQLAPGQTLRSQECLLDPQEWMQNGWRIPTWWGQIAHAVGRIYFDPNA